MTRVRHEGTIGTRPSVNELLVFETEAPINPGLCKPERVSIHERDFHAR
jgi:hypothetical protein